MLFEHEKNEDSKPCLENGSNEINTKDKDNATVMDFEECENEESDSSDGDMLTIRSNRSSNFLPQECSLLLKCVREEKNNIFNKETNAKTNLLKKSAWTRIAESFNKQSPQKRCDKVLRTKFHNMKKAAKAAHMKQYSLNNKHEKEDVRLVIWLISYWEDRVVPARAARPASSRGKTRAGLSARLARRAVSRSRASTNTLYV
ncbi:hypothetical protein RR46_00758 [Papilio xuthus]|uniref:Regulatory protein zeste n=1 Tax=Papilio xuthus TaxID=66420 RepID=A0A0N1IBU5_PAPXU|nr:hypothetical protein RR46_00758 [Papilio xuthus]